MDPNLLVDHDHDPELTPGLIKLLSDRIKDLRQQLRDCRCKAPSQVTLDEGLDLSEENRKLRHEVDDLRLRLRVATEGEDNKLQLLVPSDYDDLCHRLTRALEEQKLREAQHANDVEQLNSKLISSREKYKVTKEARNTIQTAFDDLRSRYDDFHNRHNDLQSRYDKVVEERDLARTKEATPEFDIPEFITRVRTSTLQPESIVNFAGPKGWLSNIPDAIKEKSAPYGVLMTRSDEVIWPEMLRHISL